MGENIIVQEEDKFMKEKQLNNYLLNRKHLDFALKLALGSEAYLHDISSIDEDSLRSFDSLEPKHSPNRSECNSLGKRLKKSRFASKQNFHQNQNKQTQQNNAQNTNNQKNMKQLYQRMSSWIEFIQERCKINNNLLDYRYSNQNTPKKQKRSIQSTKKQTLTTEKINNFFKEIVFKLQRLELIEKQEYNSKFMLCQLTEAAIYQQQAQQQIIKLKSEVSSKIFKIQQLQQKINNLKYSSASSNEGKFQNCKKLGLDSVVEFTISQSSNANISLPNSIITLKKKLQSQKKDNLHQFETSPEKRNFIEKQATTAWTSHKQNDQQHKDPKQKETYQKNLFNNYFNQQNDEQMLLTGQLKFNEGLQRHSSQKHLNNLEQSDERIVQNSDVRSSSDNFSYLQLLEIKQEMSNLIKENEKLRKLIDQLEGQNQEFKLAIQGQQIIISEGKIQSEDHLKNEEEISESTNFMNNGSQLNNGQVQHPKIQRNQDLYCYGCRNPLQSDTKKNQGQSFQYEGSKQLQYTKLLLKQQEQQNQQMNIENMSLKSQCKDISDEKKMLEEYVSTLECKMHEMEEKFKQMIIEAVQLQVNSPSSNYTDGIIQQIEPITNQIETIIQENESLLLTQGVDSERIIETNKEIKDTGSKNRQKELRQMLLVILGYNQKLKIRLKRAKGQLSHIKSVLRQAKSINDADIVCLQKSIHGRKANKNKQVEELKIMEEKWKRELLENKQKKLKQLALAQQKNKNLTLTLNRNRFKCFRSKNKNKGQKEK